MFDEPSEPWHFATARQQTRVQALRAALGILRSTFSIAVVSRFEEYKTAGGKWLRHAGYFEEHRIQVRWLIRKAALLAKTSHEQQPDSEHLGAFYRDEIIWLYNECGVICLVQGNLIDAVTLFRHALIRNQQIEGFGDNGAQHCRIQLNLAVAQIERGRLSSALPRLQAVLRNCARESEIYAMADGYLALVHHLKGEGHLAMQHYTLALNRLRELQDSRAVSIFARHCADLHRHLGQLDQCRSLVAESVAAAEGGGHEDLLKKAQLSLVRLSIVSDGTTHVRDHLHQLRQIESYANTMDMPALYCEANHLHAELLLAQGETTLAGKLLQNVISKANRNGLQLRLTSALTLYGKVMLSRNENDNGRKLLLTALEMVKKYGVQIEIDRIEKNLVAFK